MPAAYLVYSDGSIDGNRLDSNQFGLQIRANTSPNEYGVRFVAPFTMDVYGMYFGLAFLPSADRTIRIRLYDGSDNVLLEQMFSEVEEVSTDINVLRANPVAIFEGGLYRVALQFGGTSSVFATVHRMPFASVLDRNQSLFDAPSTWQVTHRTDDGAWTDEDARFGAVAGLIVDLPVVGEGGATKYFGHVS